VAVHFRERDLLEFISCSRRSHSLKVLVTVIFFPNAVMRLRARETGTISCTAAKAGGCMHNCEFALAEKKPAYL
jgi:hypothetical protein